MLKIGVLKIELLMLRMTDFIKAKFFPCFRDRTWAKIYFFFVAAIFLLSLKNRRIYISIP